ncbi:hypothetical protein B7993_12465 [Fibrobacter sp. UWH3]|nr:hypothetical protein B7993_12465 [Fibrobacter sp. UWH3]
MVAKPTKTRVLAKTWLNATRDFLPKCRKSIHFRALELHEKTIVEIRGKKLTFCHFFALYNIIFFSKRKHPKGLSLGVLLLKVDA